MKEYHKINTIFRRDMTKTNKPLIIGQYSMPEYDYLKNNIWEFSEKIDGTNIRAIWSPLSKTIIFKGKTDNAQIPAMLFQTLMEKFTKEKLIEVFPEIDVCLYGEGYGCLSSNTGIILADGATKTIAEIVNNKLNVDVLTYNFEKGILESSNILNYFKYPTNKLIRIETEKTRKGGRGRFNQIVCTEDHLIYTDMGYVKARDIKINDKILILQRDLSFLQKQILYGILLGDGCLPINTYDVHISHSTKQIEYINLIKKIFSNVHICESKHISGYGSNMISLVMSNKELFKEFVDNCIINKKKTINNNWLNEITPLSLAFWYMDDGSIDNLHRKNQVVRLATQGFSTDELVILQKELYIKYKIKGTLKKAHKKGQFYLQLSVEEASKFFILVAPYIIGSLKYKLPKYLQSIPCIFDYIDDDNEIFKSSKALKSTRVKAITKCLNNKINKEYIYDIQTKNENFFIGSGFLVHNSKIQSGGNYIPDGNDFILFDIRIGEWWLKREDVENIAKKFNIGVVPIIGEGTLNDLIDLVKSGFKSQIAQNKDYTAEGIVARPKVELKARNGERIITKLKYCDFKEG